MWPEVVVAGLLCMSMALLAAATLGEEKAALLVRAGAPELRPPSEAPERELRPSGAVGLRLRASVDRWRTRRRTGEMGSQLADAVSAIASGSRAGLSLQQAVELAGEQVPPPLGPSLREVADRAALG